MNILGKFQTIIIFAALIFGLLFGQVAIISDNASHFVVPFLFAMLFGVFLGKPLKDFTKGFSNFRFTRLTLLINFIWTPLLAYFLGAIFLNQEPALWIGFVMLMVTPCTDWYIVFTNIARGNVPLSASILPLNLVLQLILLPVYLLLFFGASGTFDTGMLIESIVCIVLLPFIPAQIVRYLLSKWNSIERPVISFFTSAQIIFLSLAIFCMFASQGRYLLDNLMVVLILFIPILLFFIINFLLVRVVAKIAKLAYGECTSLCLTTLARNSPIALAIAVVAFPNEPLIALTLVIGPLIELPVLAIVSQVLLFIKERAV